MAESKYANIALNIPVYDYFTYAVPDYLKDSAFPGMRVIVPFSSRIVTGIIVSFVDKTDIKNIRFVKSLVDDVPLLSDEMLQLGKWISEYYVSPPGEVLFNFLPDKNFLKKELHFMLHEDYLKSIDLAGRLDDIYEEIIRYFESVKKRKITINHLKSIFGRGIVRRLDFLSEKRILIAADGFRKPVKEKKEKVIIRNFDVTEIENVLAGSNLRSAKQKAVINSMTTYEKIKLSDLKEKTGSSYSTIYSLVDKGLLKIEEHSVDRAYSVFFNENRKRIFLNDEQKNCLDKIGSAIDSSEYRTFLLYGITGSGKTEIYIQSLKTVIQKGKTGIILVPEISLTPQLINRFRHCFGNVIGVVHSKLSKGERYDTYKNLYSGRYKIVIGARSALFSPLKNIGIIVIDEEHDFSYKQDNNPKYHARDAAVFMGKLNKAVVVLGSATPSLESYRNALLGKFELLQLKKRATNAILPDIKIIDMSERRYNKELDEKTKEFDINKIILNKKFRFLSDELIIKIGEKLEKKEGVIILQNKRGYHSYVECSACGNVELCDHCNISLTYHKSKGMLVCHLCGFIKNLSTKCSNCGSGRLFQSGTGTEKVEEELCFLYPKAKISRIDSDVLNTKSMFQKILSDFYNSQIDILVGTQIISKGLDFPNVTLVGVVNSDIGLLLPDFRSAEKTFQLLTQVSGRSGRDVEKGEVIIQTNHKDYGIFKFIGNHDYYSFAESELSLRNLGKYPPYYRLAIVEIRSKNVSEAESLSKKVYDFMIKSVNNDILILKPSQPLFSKVRDFYRYHILVKISKNSAKSQENILKVFSYLMKEFKSTDDLKVSVDNDAYDLL